ncbi:hypothetical protein DFH09DRAFT_1106972 [Mycena vulgaris]|nr:hypothetical protein DFH09DRAFT_1106972 [Mycena vulgaris]
MKPFNRLAIIIVSALVTSAVVAVNLCCPTAVGTNLEFLKILGYDGPQPFDIELIASTCERSFLDNAVAINCLPVNFPVPPGVVELCCVQIVLAADALAKQALSEAGYNGSSPGDVALGCTNLKPWFAIIPVRKDTFWSNHPS